VASEDDPSPFDDADYLPWSAGAEPSRPSTAEVGRLARDIHELTGVGGTAALLGAIYIDQGRATDALKLIQGIVDKQLEEAEARAEARKRSPR